jgi:thiosulfate/3-mercaptopyruvate sulfurtransferase
MGTPEEFAALAVRLGIGLNTMVVAYEGTQAGMLVWALRLHGHAKAAILDGGYVKWAAEGRSASREPVSYPAGAFSPKPLAESYCSLSQAKAFAGSKDVVFWDVRTPEEYLGKRPMNNTAPERNGHIPNAVNLDWNELFDPVTKTMKTAAECRAMLTRLGVKPEAEIVTY